MYELFLALSLLGLLAFITAYEALTDHLPNFLLNLACIFYLLVVLEGPETGQHLVGGAVGIAAVLAILLASESGRHRWHDSRVGLCVGLVTGWPLAAVVLGGWLAIVFASLAYLLATRRFADALAISLLPFLVLSTFLVFIFRAASVL